LKVELVGDIAEMVHLAQYSNGYSPDSEAVHGEFAAGKSDCGGRICTYNLQG
jgi:hypothetical protein